MLPRNLAQRVKFNKVAVTNQIIISDFHCCGITSFLFVLKMTQLKHIHICIIANFLILTANIMLTITNPTFQLLAEVLFRGQLRSNSPW